MKLLLSAVLVFTAAAVKSESSRDGVVVNRYSGTTCNQGLLADTWTVQIAVSPVFQTCTPAAHTDHTTGNSGTAAIPEGYATIADLTALAKLQRSYQALHLTCSDGAYAMGVYATAGDGTADCATETMREEFTVNQSSELAAGQCAETTTGYSYRMTLNTLSLPDCSPGVTGDPHLTNLRGEKFDIHDGLHRLVHYPRGVPKEEALFMVDAQAVDMGKDNDCYSVYLDSVKISGKWVGDEISLSSHTNSSVTSSNPSTFFMSFASESIDWPTLAKRQVAHLNLKGSMPVTVATSTRKAFGDDAVGGEELTLKIGEQHPVLVQVWSSHARNALTQGQEVGYLNVQVKNLPANAGGIIGLDSYSRPSNAQCDHVQGEVKLLHVIKTEASEVSFLRLTRPRPQWTALATTQEQ